MMLPKRPQLNDFFGNYANALVTLQLPEGPKSLADIIAIQQKMPFSTHNAFLQDLFTTQLANTKQCITSYIEILTLLSCFTIETKIYFTTLLIANDTFAALIKPYVDDLIKRLQDVITYRNNIFPDKPFSLDIITKLTNLKTSSLKRSADAVSSPIPAKKSKTQSACTMHFKTKPADLALASQPFYTNDTNTTQLFQGQLGASAVTVKAIDLKKLQRNEYRLITQFNHDHNPYIIQLKGYYTFEEKMHLVFDYMVNGSLYDYVRKNELSHIVLMKLFQQIATGLMHLHQVNIVHRDIKGQNILIKQDGNAVIADFGFAKPIDNIIHYAGTLAYVAPEILADESPYRPPADIYSFGITLWSALTKQTPLAGKDRTAQCEFICKWQWREPIPKTTPDHVAHLIRLCWMHEAGKRITAEALSEQLTVKANI